MHSFITVELLSLLNSTWKIYIRPTFLSLEQDCLNSATDVHELIHAVQINKSVNMRSGVLMQ